MLARSYAMEAYTGLEQSLCDTFAHLTGMERDVAGLVFFKIGSARARDSIIETLVKRKFSGEFNKSWNSILKLTGVFAQKRNELAHWGVVIEIGSEDGTVNLDSIPNNATLVPPNFWWRTSDEPPQRTINEIFSWGAEFAYLSRKINVFNFWFLDAHELPPDVEVERPTLREKYLEAIPYPPPEDDPQFRKPPVWHNPRQSSAE